ncbi:ricin-type beta-trefoil lectin domain protein [Streptomyces fildesensis]|uniref:Ricin-type beta-trefoil lectin domain protein n=1 Tax=Streptomyces fildesensis TaxID=375757 RepID=A0ABW8C553_9ACTN
MSHRNDLSDTSELSDAQLAELVLEQRPEVAEAIAELRRRHLPRVRAYAGLCCSDDASAQELADRAFVLALGEAGSGEGPRGPWRLRVLDLVHRAAAEWLHDGRADRLGELYAAHLRGDESCQAPGSHAPRSSPAPTGDAAGRGVLAQAFAALVPRVQRILWYAVVERESDADVALFAGEMRHVVQAQATKARDAYREAVLCAFLERAAEPACSGFRRMLEAAARRSYARHHAELAAHLARCAGCEAALGALIDIEERPGPTVSAGVLGWDSDSYARGVPSEATAVDRGPSDTVPGVRSRLLPGFCLRTCAGFQLMLAVALVVGIAVSSDVAPSRGRHGTGTLRAGGGDGLATAVGLKPPTAPSRSVSPLLPLPRRPSPSTRSASAGPPTSTLSPVSSPSAAPATLGPVFTPLVNLATGRCLDMPEGDYWMGEDVVTRPCRPGSVTQQWRLTSRGVVQNAADTSYCLDSRGYVESVGIWRCRAVDDPETGVNMRFLVDSAGRLRPVGDAGFAVAEGDGTDGWGVRFVPVAENRPDQRWYAQ